MASHTVKHPLEDRDDVKAESEMKSHSQVHDRNTFY